METAAAFTRALGRREFLGTASRLLTVRDLLRQITAGAAVDPEIRLAALRRQRAEIDEQIADIRSGTALTGVWTTPQSGSGTPKRSRPPGSYWVICGRSRRTSVGPGCAAAGDVGETLAEVQTEDGTVALPLLCLAVAATSAPMDILEVLVRDPTVFVFSDEPSEWQALSAARDLTGELPAASAVLAAIDWSSPILTRTPGRYEQLDHRVPLIIF